MEPACPSLLFGFDQLEGPSRGCVLRPTRDAVAVPRARNLDETRATDPLLSEYLIANRRRLGLELRLAPTERAAASLEPWLYELAIHNREAEERYFRAPEGFWPMLPPAVQAGLTTGAARLAITNLIEGTSLPLLGRLYDYLESVGLDPERVGYFCGTSNLAALHDELCTERAIVRRIHVAGVSFWEERTYADFLLEQGRYRIDRGRTLTVGQFAEAAFAPAVRPAAFLCLNGKGRHHRWALTSLLLTRGLLDRGIVSFHSREPEDTVWWPEGDLGAEAREGAAALRELVPIVADRASSPPSGPWFSSHLYLRTTFSVVAETLFTEEPAAFCSEKTFRPILHLHPFVVLGPPGVLRALRASGYETFSPFVNEAYDEMTNPTSRLAAVATEVTRLAGLTAAERADGYRALRDRLEHNLCRLLSQRFHDRDALDVELLATLAALHEGRPAVSTTPDPGPARAARMRLPDLPADVVVTAPATADNPPQALRVAARLWRSGPRAFERFGVRPVRAAVDRQAIELELASEAGRTVVHLQPSEGCARAYCRTSTLAIFYSGVLPHPEFTRLLDRLTRTLAGLDFEAVRAMCER